VALSEVLGTLRWSLAGDPVVTGKVSWKRVGLQPLALSIFYFLATVK
jgi:hypothetical protein